MKDFRTEAEKMEAKRLLAQSRASAVAVCDAKYDSVVEQEFIDDTTTWETFVGGMTVEDFLDRETAEEAIEDFLANYKGEQPAWLGDSLSRYIESF
jgi:hypothetical protein